MRRLSAAVAAFSLPLASVGLLGAAPAHAVGTANIQITEISYGGLAAVAGDAGDGEYVELTNVGTAAQDFAGWNEDVVQGATDEGHLDLSGLGTVQPGESVIITDLTPSDFRTEWGLKANVKVISDKQGVATAITLNGGPDTVSIYDNSATLVDQVGYAAKASTCNVPSNGCFTGKGVSAEVQAGGTASTTLASGWTNPSTVGDTDGAWTSTSGAVGSPGVSALGTAVDSARTAASIRETGETGAAAGADIQATEIAYGGLASGAHAYASDTGDGEYLELTNVGDAAQDMTGWYDDVAQGANPPNRLDLSGFGTIQPGESVIITDLSAADFRTEWGLKPSVKVITDKQGVTPAVTMNGGPDTIAIGNTTGVAENLSYVAGDLTTKGVAAFVNYGQLASTSLASGWTKTALVGDSEGSWTSASGAVGSPAASTQGSATPAGVRTVVSTALAVNGAANETDNVNTPFSFTGLAASGGTAPYTWSAPALTGTGLSIDSSTGAITGTPTTVGVINVTATVTDSVAATASASFTITVLGGIDPHWANIVINEVTSDNEDNPELTTHLPAALATALNVSPNLSRDLVEIYNKGSQAVDITGWKQADSGGVAVATDFSGRVFDVNGNAITSIPAHGYGVFQSGKGLSSGGDAVSIYLPDGTPVDSVSFDGSQAGYDSAYDPTNAGPNPTTETYHTLSRCPNGAGAVNIGSDANGTPWHSVKVASFGSSNDASCDTSTDPAAAVTKYNEQPPTGLPGTCKPSAPSGSDSVTVPGAVAWPTSDVAVPVDNACEFVQPTDPTGNDMSGLVFSSDGSVLWGAQNKNHLWKLVKDPTTGKYLPATDNGWSNGKAITFTGTDPTLSQPDSEGLTIGSNGDIFTTSERDNHDSNTSKDEVLEYDPTAAGTTLAPVRQWDLTSEFVPSQIAATGEDANLGFEGVTYVPDSFLTAHGFRDQHLSKTYNPADYPLHGTGLFFMAFEDNGHIYGYALNSDGSFQRVADIDTGVDGTSAIADVQFNADDQGLWAHCDNDCGVADSLLKINASGDFARVASYQRPSGLPDDNFEGFAIAPASTAVNGKREVVWSDDGIYGGGNAWNADKTANVPSVGWGHALFAGTLPTAAPTALTGTIPATATVGTPYTSPSLKPTGGLPAIFTYSLSSGSLPAGLSLNPSTGAITGVPTGPPGASGFAIAVTNGMGTATLPATITVAVPGTGNAGTPGFLVHPIVGKPKPGKTLSVSVTLPSGATVTYQWYAGKKAIKHATKSKLKLTNKLRHRRIKVRVTVTLPGQAPVTKILTVAKPVR